MSKRSGRVKSQGVEAEARVPPLFVAVERGDVFAIRICLENGADPEERAAVATGGFDGDVVEMTALGKAICEGDHKAAEILASVSKLDAASIGGMTPLIYAVDCGRFAIVDLLLRAGADPQVAGAEGHAPLMLAIGLGGHGWENGWIEGDVWGQCLELLLPTGDFQRVGLDGRTVMEAVARDGMPKLADRMRAIEARREQEALDGHLSKPAPAPRPKAGL